jgi:hypothetical protein
MAKNLLNNVKADKVHRIDVNFNLTKKLNLNILVIGTSLLEEQLTYYFWTLKLLFIRYVIVLKVFSDDNIKIKLL